LNVASGRINLDGTLWTLKRFIRFGLFYKPDGSFSLTATLTIDSYSGQAFTFTQVSSSDVLGVSFTLGMSPLGSSPPTAPYQQPVDGLGRVVKISILNSGLNDRVELLGMALEYEPAGTSQEVL
jgi:hypothetical protein